MHVTPSFSLAVALSVTASTFLAAQPVLRANVTNQLDQTRASETVELPYALLKGAFRAEDLARVVVTDAGSSREVLSQAVDEDGDGVPDRLVFQSNFGPGETRGFVLAKGDARSFRKDEFRVYGRFVRERFDDFAWENDLVAHRVYGPALETWQKEPLTSSGVDVWAKRTRALVVNDWYMVDDYHRDHGEGGDFYSVGPSRGCGGGGVWKDGRLWVSKNFRGSRVLANGPIRLIFELQYEPWDAGGIRVSERKRVTLDAGSHFNRIESFVAVDGAAGVAWAAGIKKAKGAEVRFATEQGILRIWEALKEPNGHLGCALVFAPERVDSVAEADGNVLLIGEAKGGAPVVYYAGSGWDKAGEIPGVAAWDAVVDDLAQRLRSPLAIAVVAR
jgi:unsaturated rhamnogalacturonyl hydrolase